MTQYRGGGSTVFSYSTAPTSFAPASPCLLLPTPPLPQVLYEPCYDTLRTKQQLGYSVHSGTRLTHGVSAFCVTVVSARCGDCRTHCRTLQPVSTISAPAPRHAVPATHPQTPAHRLQHAPTPPKSTPLSPAPYTLMHFSAGTGLGWYTGNPFLATPLQRPRRYADFACLPAAYPPAGTPPSTWTAAWSPSWRPWRPACGPSPRRSWPRTARRC